MKVFVINLDRDRERLAAVDKQLRRLGVEYERIPAVYGKSLSTVEKNGKVNRFRWGCAVGRSITDGELGCALSHAGCYHRIVDEGLDCVCILEDDVVIDDRMREVLGKLEPEVSPSVPAVYLLSNHSDPDAQDGEGVNGFTSPRDTEFQIIRVKSDMFAEAYVVSNAGARALLKANYPIITPCDWWRRWSRIGVIELYHVFPTVCRQDKQSYESHTQPVNCFDVRKLSMPAFVFYKIWRCIGKIADMLLFRLTGR